MCTPNNLNKSGPQVKESFSDLYNNYQKNSPCPKDEAKSLDHVAFDLFKTKDPHADYFPEGFRKKGSEAFFAQPSGTAPQDVLETLGVDLGADEDANRESIRLDENPKEIRQVWLLGMLQKSDIPYNPLMARATRLAIEAVQKGVMSQGEAERTLVKTKQDLKTIWSEAENGGKSFWVDYGIELIDKNIEIKIPSVGLRGRKGTLGIKEGSIEIPTTPFVKKGADSLIQPYLDRNATMRKADKLAELADYKQNETADISFSLRAGDQDPNAQRLLQIGLLVDNDIPLTDNLPYYLQHPRYQEAFPEEEKYFSVDVTYVDGGMPFLSLNINDATYKDLVKGKITASLDPLKESFEASQKAYKKLKESIHTKYTDALERQRALREAITNTDKSVHDLIKKMEASDKKRDLESYIISGLISPEAARAIAQNENIELSKPVQDHLKRKEAETKMEEEMDRLATYARGIQVGSQLFQIAGNHEMAATLDGIGNSMLSIGLSTIAFKTAPTPLNTLNMVSAYLGGVQTITKLLGNKNSPTSHDILMEALKGIAEQIKSLRELVLSSFYDVNQKLDAIIQMIEEGFRRNRELHNQAQRERAAIFSHIYDIKKEVETLKKHIDAKSQEYLRSKYSELGLESLDLDGTQFRISEESFSRCMNGYVNLAAFDSVRPGLNLGNTSLAELGSREENTQLDALYLGRGLQDLGEKARRYLNGISYKPLANPLLWLDGADSIIRMVERWEDRSKAFFTDQFKGDHNTYHVTRLMRVYNKGEEIQAVIRGINQSPETRVRLYKGLLEENYAAIQGFQTALSDMAHNYLDDPNNGYLRPGVINRRGKSGLDLFKSADQQQLAYRAQKTSQADCSNCGRHFNPPLKAQIPTNVRNDIPMVFHVAEALRLGQVGYEFEVGFRGDYYHMERMPGDYNDFVNEGYKKRKWVKQRHDTYFYDRSPHFHFVEMKGRRLFRSKTRMGVVNLSVWGNFKTNDGKKQRFFGRHVNDYETKDQYGFFPKSELWAQRGKGDTQDLVRNYLTANLKKSPDNRAYLRQNPMFVAVHKSQTKKAVRDVEALVNAKLDDIRKSFFIRVSQILSGQSDPQNEAERKLLEAAGKVADSQRILRRMLQFTFSQNLPNHQVLQQHFFGPYHYASPEDLAGLLAEHAQSKSTDVSGFIPQKQDASERRRKKDKQYASDFDRFLEEGPPEKHVLYGLFHDASVDLLAVMGQENQALKPERLDFIHERTERLQEIMNDPRFRMN